MLWPQIARVIEITVRQAKYAAVQESFRPQFIRRGRYSIIRTPLRHRISTFIEASDENQLILWHDFSLYIPELERVSTKAIGTTIREIGYQRVPRPQKIHLTPVICGKRLILANSVLNPH